MNRPQAIANGIKSNDNFDNVAHVCCDWEEFVFEVEEWGVDHISTIDFDDLTPDEVNQLDEFIASFGCSPENPHPAVSMPPPFTGSGIRSCISSWGR